MTTKNQVQQFLKDFKQKLDVFSIIYLDRDKNRNALLELGITELQRLENIKSLKPENFHSGPNKDTNDPNMPEYWEFGKMVNDKEVYIKINMGTRNNPVICMSFHIAEHKISYPFNRIVKL